ncbi:MAG TPA: dihydrofolate reductase family protein [Pseudolysinimonas sp.]|jgi:dihydrofolate reductase
MGTLIYTGITSLDGFVNDAHGHFDWAAPSDEVHAFVNDLEREVGLYLYGRRMYDVMTYWETPTPEVEESVVMNDYQRIWRQARKVVYSTTLDAVATDSTTIERVFDPEVVADLVGRADTDVSIGGPHLAAHALRADLVGEIRMFLNPIVVGDGTPFLPEGWTNPLELLDEQRFDNGVVYVRYAVGA